ncbi:MAG TPA: cobalamin biosynthesis protein CbiM, partial [Acidimicrobiia bacterium]
LRHYAGFWHNALFSGYDFSHDKHPALGYLVSAGFGIVVIAVATLLVALLVRVTHRRSTSRHPAHEVLVGQS